MKTLTYTQARITGLILLLVAVAGVVLISRLPAPREEQGNSVSVMMQGKLSRKQMI